MDYLKSSNRDCRRRCTMLQMQLKTLCEERADFLAHLQDQGRDINHLRKQLGLAEKENEDLMSYESDINDPNRPRYTTRELKELITERDEMLTVIQKLRDELEAEKTSKLAMMGSLNQSNSNIESTKEDDKTDDDEQ